MILMFGWCSCFFAPCTTENTSSTEAKYREDNRAGRRKGISSIILIIFVRVNIQHPHQHPDLHPYLHPHHLYPRYPIHPFKATPPLSPQSALSSWTCTKMDSNVCRFCKRPCCRDSINPWWHVWPTTVCLKLCVSGLLMIYGTVWD